MVSVHYRKAAELTQKLRAAGYEAYFVGGSVRDIVRGVEPGEYDIVTSATPAQVRQIFPRTYAVGESFGVTIAIEESDKYEIATFRTEEDYADGRRPSKVTVPATAEEDVKRRDFTINGLLMDPASGRIIDFVGGKADIEKKLVRTIGEPGERFAEDHLRMLRAVRFAANLGFAIEDGTFESIKGNAAAIGRISAERVRDELTKILTGPDARRGMELLESAGLLHFLLPELEELRGLAQPPRHHPEGDAWEHTLRMLSMLSAERRGRAEARLAWAALLHDVGKARSLSVDEAGLHFHGHAEKGRTLASGIMRRLKFSNKDIEAVETLVRQHMHFLNVMEMRPAKLKKFLRLPDFGLHLELHRLDRLAGGGDLSAYHFCREKLAALGEAELSPAPLITGADLIAMGFSPGPVFSRVLAEVEERQMEGVLKTPDDARRFVLEKWGREREGGPLN